jgi:hypothetical protein
MDVLWYRKPWNKKGRYQVEKKIYSFQHLDLYVRLSAQMGVRLKNKFFNRKFVLAHNKLDMHKERVQE